MHKFKKFKESVELPLTHPELYENIGIRPPKGVILYGEPGTGKTLLAKHVNTGTWTFRHNFDIVFPLTILSLYLFAYAVANSTSAAFLCIVGSELIQKYLGDGPKLVRELFRVAGEFSLSIVFIDDIDAIGTKRGLNKFKNLPFVYDAHSGGEHETQRTMLELLNWFDGFDSRGDV
ncbi:unnamed protein product [Musa banksii]